MHKLIAAIEAATRFDIVGDVQGPRIGIDIRGEYLDRDDVLRILREHAPQLARVVIADGAIRHGVDPMCVCGHSRSVHAPPADNGKCGVPDCACGPGCIHDGFVDVTHEQPIPDEWRFGLPAEPLRKAWPKWTMTDTRNGGGACLEFSPDGTGYRGVGRLAFRSFESVSVWLLCQFRPHGKSWAEVEQLAKEAELPKWRVMLAKLEGATINPGLILSVGGQVLREALRKLDALRLVIESGKGEAEVPEGLSSLVFGYSPGSILTAARDGMYVSFRSETFGTASRMIDRVRELIDQYGNSLLK